MSRGTRHTWVWPADSRCAKDSLRMWGMKQLRVKAEAQPRAAQVRIEASGLKKLNLGHDRKPRGLRTSDKLDYNRRTVTRKETNQRTALAVPTSRERHSSGNTQSGETEGQGVHTPGRWARAGSTTSSAQSSSHKPRPLGDRGRAGVGTVGRPVPRRRTATPTSLPPAVPGTPEASETGNLGIKEPTWRSGDGSVTNGHGHPRGHQGARLHESTQEDS